MADNVPITAGSGTTIASDDIGGVQHQRVKAVWGPDGTANDTDVASGKAMPVQLRGSDGTDRSNALPITDNAGSLTVDALVTAPVFVRLSDGSAAIAALPITDNSSSLTVDNAGTFAVQASDGGGSLTVDNAGTFAVQAAVTGSLTNISGTISLPTGAATAAKQPALGTAGTASVDVITIQGNASATAVPVAFSSTGYGPAVTLTRTADTNAYAANDVLGAATGSTAALTFTAGAGAGEYLITSASLEIDASAVISSETSYRLYLYNVTPPSALGDNAAWDLPSGDRASFLGYIDLGSPVDLGSTLYVQQDNINKQVTLASASLFGYLTTTTGYTPSSARVHKITLHTVPC